MTGDTKVLVCNNVMKQMMTFRWPGGWQAGRLASWLAGWLAVWLAGWLAGCGRLRLAVGLSGCLAPPKTFGLPGTLFYHTKYKAYQNALPHLFSFFASQDAFNDPPSLSERKKRRLRGVLRLEFITCMPVRSLQMSLHNTPNSKTSTFNNG